MNLKTVWASGAPWKYKRMLLPFDPDITTLYSLNYTKININFTGS